jgi:hypothetical protein
VKEIERLLDRVRSEGVPEPPDERYMVTAINRRLGRLPAATQEQDDSEWLPILAALCLAATAAAAVYYLGITPLWLLVVPLVLLTMSPILLHKGA